MSVKKKKINFRYGTIIGKPRDIEVFRDSLNPFLFEEVNLKPMLENCVERVEKKTGLSPNDISISVYVLADVDSVDEQKQRIYNGFAPDLGRPAFSDLLTNTVFIAADMASRRILLHEIGHILFSMCCIERPSPALHERVAQFCEEP